MKQAAEGWKVAVAQAAQAAKAAGRLPGGLERFAGEILAPKVDWRDVLRRFVDRCAHNDYSWSPPNRRFIHLGLYLPSLRSEELPPVVLAVDTSGSIQEEQIRQFAGEMSDILAAYHTSAKIIYCDAGIAGTEEVSWQDLPLDLHPKGGGGTDFRPPFELVAREGLEPSCLVYLTDMMCGSFPAPPDYPVLWAQIGSYRNPPPFGEVVHL